jgi:hypothetical protein
MEMGVVHDYVQPCLQRFRDQFSLYADDLAFDNCATLFPDLILARADSHRFTANVQGSQLPICPCSLAGGGKTTQKAESLHLPRLFIV